MFVVTQVSSKLTAEGSAFSMDIEMPNGASYEIPISSQTFFSISNLPIQHGQQVQRQQAPAAVLPLPQQSPSPVPAPRVENLSEVLSRTPTAEQLAAMSEEAEQLRSRREAEIGVDEGMPVDEGENVPLRGALGSPGGPEQL